MLNLEVIVAKYRPEDLMRCNGLGRRELQGGIGMGEALARECDADA